MSFIRYRGVAALLAANVGAYMILNSQFMKQRSSNDGPPRVDRHFIASRYNLANWRIWSVPFSLFNHGDSLMQLVINCAGLAIVGPAVEMAFGAGVLVSGFLIAGSLGALAEQVVAIVEHVAHSAARGARGALRRRLVTNVANLAALRRKCDRANSADVRCGPAGLGCPAATAA